MMINLFIRSLSKLQKYEKNSNEAQLQIVKESNYD